MARVRGRQEGHRLRPRRPQAQAAGHDPPQGPRVRGDRGGAPRAHPRQGRQPVRLDRQHAGEGQHRDRRRGVHRHLPQAASGRAADARLRAPAPREPLLQPEALRHGQGRASQGLEEAERRVRQAAALAVRPLDPERESGAGPGRVPADPLRHPRHGLVPGEAALERPARRLLPRRHRPLRQPPGALGRRAHPEPGACRPLAHGARRARAHDDPGRRGDHAADAHQHPARRRGHQGVLRLEPAQPVHGPDEPAGRSHAQAPSLGARPRRSVA